MADRDQLEQAVAHVLLTELADRGPGDDDAFVRRVLAQTAQVEEQAAVAGAGLRWLAIDLATTAGFLVVGTMLALRFTELAPLFAACLGLGTVWHLCAPTWRRMRARGAAAGVRASKLLHIRTWIDQGLALTFSIAAVIILQGLP